MNGVMIYGHIDFGDEWCDNLEPRGVGDERCDNLEPRGVW